MSRTSYDLIIFDCDGTLVDSHDMNHSIMAEIANEYGNLSYSMKSVEEEYLGVDYNKFFKMVASKEGLDIPEEASCRCVELALKNIPFMMCKVGGAAETLLRLSSGYKMTVCSNANKQIVLDSLKATNIDHFFEAEKIVAGRAMATPKPSPDLFLMAADKMGVAPSKCLVIEDSPTGVQAGVAAGMDVWGFTGVSHDPQAQEKCLKEAGATAIYTQLIHIAERLGY